jgi:putative ABC transport system ATP-binding protein
MGLHARRHHYPHELSGGEMQRVAICRALINDPEIILADEPTGNLDSASGKQVLEILRQLRDRHGKTVILVTHSQDGAAMADRVIRIHDGKLL